MLLRCQWRCSFFADTEEDGRTPVPAAIQRHAEHLKLAVRAAYLSHNPLDSFMDYPLPELFAICEEIKIMLDESRPKKG